MSAMLDEKFLSEHQRIAELLSSTWFFDFKRDEIASRYREYPNKLYKPCGIAMDLSTALRDAVPAGLTSDELVAFDKQRRSWIKERKSVVTEFARQGGAADTGRALQALALAITGVQECKAALAVGLGITDPASLTAGPGISGGTSSSSAGAVGARETGLVKEVAAVVGGVAAMGLSL
ncbi:hypothetical protein B0T21DRAFT_369109 [Apiosordaria backusii]|uniref:Uncharacterized protein n=1 Tax=Apiosordaria backusii TaxID=314023 RepID=A0AA40BDZ4_9PEZI|nr:hypothetical protein B0T21DRAFT_369109 [Apiosordaria backusii]